MSEKRKFLVENFETIQKARARKPRPLSYTKIAKILSANGMKVSAQLVVAVCKEHEETKARGGVAALDGAATKLDKKAARAGSPVVGEEPARYKTRKPPARPAARKPRPK